MLSTTNFARHKAICIDYKHVGKWAEDNRINYTTYSDLAGKADVYDLIEREVVRVNATLPEKARIQKFLLLYKELDADDGEMTRTRKVRRVIVADKFKDLVDALYDGSETISTTTEVTYEDGRKGSISATLELRDAQVVPVASKLAAE